MDAQETRRLLELAARAFGIDVTRCLQYEDGAFDWPGKAGRWDPLTNDGDALRLAVKLNMQVAVGVVLAPGLDVIIDSAEDPYAATRRAIVRAAAAIGEQMENKQS